MRIKALMVSVMLSYSFPAMAETVPLWQGLNQGMTPAQVASTLSSMDGIKSVKIKSKKGIPEDVKISYVSEGMPLGDVEVYLNPTFVASQLVSVEILKGNCESEGQVFAELILTSLTEKYGQSRPITYVDSGGVDVGNAIAFSNGITRVTVKITTKTPRPPALPLDGQTSFLYNSQRMTYLEQMTRCARDNGRSLAVEITYTSEVVSQRGQDALQNTQEAKGKAVKDGL